MRVFNYPVQTNTLLNTSFKSTFVPLKNIFMYSMAAIVTGTPNGVVTLEASNDPETDPSFPSSLTPTNWVKIKSSDFTLTSSGRTLWNVQGIAYNYVRLSYADSSGGTSTATMTIIYNGKGA